MHEYIITRTEEGKMWLLPARRHIENQYDTRPTETEAACILRRCEEFEGRPQAQALRVTVEAAGFVYVDATASPKQVDFRDLTQWEADDEK